MTEPCWFEPKWLGGNSEFKCYELKCASDNSESNYKKDNLQFQSQESIKELMHLISGKLLAWSCERWGSINEPRLQSIYNLLSSWDSWEQDDGETCGQMIDQLNSIVNFAISEWGSSEHEQLLVEAIPLLETLRKAVLTKTIDVWADSLDWDEIEREHYQDLGE